MVTMNARRVEIPTYVPYPPDKNPIFFEKRNVQGASGKVFPMAFSDRMEQAFRPVSYEQVTLENEYIDISLLPEIGGRIYTAVDKGNGYDFIYRNRNIKPQQIGLCGPWVSGGIEFNWPQHHRPTTFSPLPYVAERNQDGSTTVWMGEVEPQNRTKGMVGVTVYPGKSYIEAKIRLFNRTPYPQTFLWWANLAVAVNDNYRAVFPEDIHWSSDHAWALTTEFPVIKGLYKTLDFGSGVDVRNFKDMPLPTSFFTYNSKYDFLSGYDFGVDSGIVHIANRHVSPGKKMFTWGVSDFSRAWFDNLSDADGPYIELMTGVYSCNQPDFAWIMPNEYKTAEQYWYPIRGIGEVKSATLDGAIGFERKDGAIDLALNATARYQGARAVLTCGGDIVWEAAMDIAPDKPFRQDGISAPDAPSHAFQVALYAPDGSLLVSYRPEKPAPVEVPAPLTPAPEPAKVDTVENLYLHALHLWQYRHPYYSPVDYLAEALRRAPDDIRANTLLGKVYLDQGLLEKAEACFETACRHSTMRNPNPYDTEPFYQLGVTQRLLGKEEAAYANLYKAVWGYAWKSAGYAMLAEMDCKKGNWREGLAHADEALWANGANFKAMRIRATILRRMGRYDDALAAIKELITKDRMDYAAAFERVRLLEAIGREAEASEALAQCSALLQGQVENHLDIAIEYGQMGLYDEAQHALQLYADGAAPGDVSPIAYYYLAHFAQAAGDAGGAEAYAVQAMAASVEGCLHSRLESIAVLKSAMERNEGDANAPYLLGNMYYGKDLFEEAIACYEISVARGAAFATAYRNLAIGYFDKQGKKREAGELIQKAFDMNPQDHRVFYELMQYHRNTGLPVKERLALLRRHADLAAMRDDLYVKAIATRIEDGAYEEALEMLSAHAFHPYEGGEGVLTREHIAANLLLGMRRLAEGVPGEALALFEKAREIPKHYNEGKRPMRYEHAHLDYCMALAYKALGDAQKAAEYFALSAQDGSENPEMDYYAVQSLKALGKDAEAKARADKMLRDTDALLANEGKYPYFTKSLVCTLPFEHDTKLNNEAQCSYFYGLAHKVLGNAAMAEAQLQKALSMKPTLYMAEVIRRGIL